MDRQHRERDPDRVRLTRRRRHAQVDHAALADAWLFGERLQRVETREVTGRLVVAAADQLAEPAPVALVAEGAEPPRRRQQSQDERLREVGAARDELEVAE